jgi:hypothetical protein
MPEQSEEEGQQEEQTPQLPSRQEEPAAVPGEEEDAPTSHGMTEALRHLSSAQPDLLKSMLTGAALIGSAVGGGYGLKAHVDSKKRD